MRVSWMERKTNVCMLGNINQNGHWNQGQLQDILDMWRDRGVECKMM